MNKVFIKRFDYFSNDRADIGTALIKARNEGLDPFTVLEAIMPWEEMIASVEEAKQLSRPKDYDYLDLLEKRFFFFENIHLPYLNP